MQPPGTKTPLVRQPTEEESTVTVNVNKACILGPFLDSKRISELATTYGPSNPVDMFQTVMQFLIDSSSEHSKSLGALIAQGNGKPVMVGKLRLKLVQIDSIEKFWLELRSFLKKINSCEGLIADGECVKCELESERVSEQKRPFSENCDSEVLLKKKPLIHKLSSNKTETDEVTLSKRSDTSKPLTSPSCPIKLEATSSNLSKDLLILSKPGIQSNGQGRAEPTEWSVEEVIQYITSSDPSMQVHADSFRKHVKHNFSLISNDFWCIEGTTSKICLF